MAKIRADEYFLCVGYSKTDILKVIQHCVRVYQAAINIKWLIFFVLLCYIIVLSEIGKIKLTLTSRQTTENNRP